MKGFRYARSASIAGAYLAFHLPFLAPSLEDIDSINFALGLRDFDVASHQPHPPGYPVYIALGRLSLALITALSPALETVRAEALALSVWSALAGAVAIAAAWALFAAIDASRRTTLVASALLAVAPLFWLTGLRPMSDLPGLAVALSAQALIVRGIADPRFLLAGAFVAGVACGIRIQSIVLTLPLLALVPALARADGMPGSDTVRSLTRAAAGLFAGILVWAVPLIVASGGIGSYMRAVSVQAGEAWVEMLWADPSPRRLAISLYQTLVLPWSGVALAVAVGAAAAIGVGHTLARDRRPLLLLAAAFGPYFGFHLLFQETLTVRYALPILPAVAWLAARGASTAGRPGAVGAVVLIAWAALVALPAGVAYGREVHPAFRAIADMDAQAGRAASHPAGAPPPAAIFSHYSVRRPLQARAPRGVPVVEPPRAGEWLDLVDYWRRGRTAPVWFLADQRRTDLASIDPHAQQPIRYRWRVGERPELSGTRPLGVDWYRFDLPGWFAGAGWSLTPETGGLTQTTETGPDRRPVEAYVRRGRGPMHLMVGGGYIAPDVVSGLGRTGDVSSESVVFDLSIDDTPVETWTLETGGGGRFVRFIDLPDGLPPGVLPSYARLAIAARAAAPGRPVPPVAIRQFDIQPAGQMIHAFAEGWHDEEYDNSTGQRWRWTSDRSVVRVSPPEGVRLTLRGESPARYFDEPPRVQITANGRTIAAFRPDDDFEWEVTVPAADVAAAGGAIAIETDQVYLPGEAEGTADPRRLALRMFAIEVHPVSP